jgi:hypothetical protein
MAQVVWVLVGSKEIPSGACQQRDLLPSESCIDKRRRARRRYHIAFELISHKDEETQKETDLPGSTGALNQESTGDIDGCLGHVVTGTDEVRIAKIGMLVIASIVLGVEAVKSGLNVLNHMVCNPEPHVLEVARARFCQVHHQASSVAT